MNFCPTGAGCRSGVPCGGCDLLFDTPSPATASASGMGASEGDLVADRLESASGVGDLVADSHGVGALVANFLKNLRGGSEGVRDGSLFTFVDDRLGDGGSPFPSEPDPQGGSPGLL